MKKVIDEIEKKHPGCKVAEFHLLVDLNEAAECDFEINDIEDQLAEAVKTAEPVDAPELTAWLQAPQTASPVGQKTAFPEYASLQIPV